jgi:hypothetical protein
VFELFRIWLLVVGLAIVVGGAFFALAADSAPMAGLNLIIRQRFWPDGEPEGARELRRWLEGIIGGTMAGWGLMVAIVAAGPFSARQVGLWWALAGGTVLWYVLDTGRSVQSRVWSNVAINTALLVLIAVPLAATFGEFH